MPTQADLDAAYALIEQAAIKGERCPQNHPHGPLFVGATTALCKLGKIKIEIYAINWRVIALLEGPHKGKRTKAPTWKCGPPYRTIQPDDFRDRTVKLTKRKITVPVIRAPRVATSPSSAPKPKPAAPGPNLYRSNFEPT